MSELTLITFPPSLDSEFARFLLTHYGVAYREQRHVIPISSFYTLRHGRTVLFPLLYGDDVRLDRVRKLIDHFEPRVAQDRRLIPPDVDETRVHADWKLFHSELGGATTVLAYHHLLPQREIMVEPLSEGAPRSEVTAVERAYPLFAGVIRLLLRPTARRASHALSTVRSLLGRVDERLSDGRRWLNGDAFGLADMAFAVAAAPVVWPDNYGGAIPALAQTPRALRAVVAECRDRPSGAFALRIYKDHRGI
jgi:glutathione S-transferase